MSVDAGTVKGTLRGDTGNFTASFVKAQLVVDGIRKGFGLLNKALTGTVRFMHESAEMAGVQEQALTKMSSALQRAGVKDAPAATREFAKFAGELQKVTTFGDEGTIAAASIGASFGLTGDKLKQATKAALGMSTVLGTNLKSAFSLIGRAAQGQVTVLSRYIGTIDDSLSQQEKFNVALERMGTLFGGAAQDEAKTYLGRLEQMDNAWGDMRESVGKAWQSSKLINAVIAVTTERVADLGGWIDANQETIKGWILKGWGKLVQAMDVFLVAGGFVVKFFKGLQIAGTGALLALAKGWQLQLKLIDFAFIQPLQRATDSLFTFIGKIGELAERGRDLPFVGDELAAIGDALQGIEPPDLSGGFDKLQGVADTAVAAFTEVINEQLEGFEATDEAVEKLRAKLAKLNADVRQTAEGIEVVFDRSGEAADEAGEKAGEAAAKAAAAADKAMEESAQKARQIAQNIGENLGGAMAEIARGQATAEEALRSVAATALKAVQRVVVAQITADQAAAASTTARATQQVTANAATAASGAAASQAAVPIIGPALAAGAMTAMFALVIGLLTRFHSGSNGPLTTSDMFRAPGLRPNEGMVIVEAGETITSKEDTRRQGGGGVTVVNNYSHTIPVRRSQIRRHERKHVIPELRRMRVLTG